MEESKIHEIDIMLSLSKALDLVSHKVAGHHFRVAYISYKIAEVLRLPISIRKNIVYSALIHDVGALSLKERLETLNFDFQDKHRHAYIGYYLIKTYIPFLDIANIIKYHHYNWEDVFNNKDIHIPIESLVLNFADRVDVLIDWDKSIKSQYQYIIDRLKLENKKFLPEILDEFSKNFQSIMTNLNLDCIENILRKNLQGKIISVNDLNEMSKLCQQIIDFRSRFTAAHSSGVSYVAAVLGRKLNMTQNEVLLLKIAGRLHDLGKLAIPKEILEKEGKLDKKEFEIIKKHALYTYNILNDVRGLKNITTWAAFHHERLDGTGYPFGLKSSEISLGSRIMAVADIFTAITEDRPYRRGMEKDKVLSILEEKVIKNHIDSSILNVLVENYKEINLGRRNTQKESLYIFKGFQANINKHLSEEIT